MNLKSLKSGLLLGLIAGIFGMQLHAAAAVAHVKPQEPAKGQRVVSQQPQQQQQAAVKKILRGGQVSSKPMPASGQTRVNVNNL